jgi:hypothetical protein
MDKIVTFGFSANKDCKPFSVAIQLIEKRPYSHVYIKYVDELTGDAMIFQASHGDVNLISESKFLQDNMILEEYEMNVSEEIYLRIRKKMNSLLGLKYSILQILNIMVQKIFKSKDIKLVVNGDKQFICSELGFVILEEARPEVIADQDSVTPSDFNRIINIIGIKRVI